ncbi:MAG: hypothetical protein ABIP39_12450, partial [Polyangiaceae bacterium]
MKKHVVLAVPFLSFASLLAHCSSATTDAMTEPAGGDGGTEATMMMTDDGGAMADTAPADTGADAPVGPVQHETEPNN